LVLWYENDLQNDHAHPHSTVIDGWFVDNVFLDSNDDLVKLDDSVLRKKIERKLDRLKREHNRILNYLWKYSIMVHIASKIMHKTGLKVTDRVTHNQSLKDLYRLDRAHMRQDILPYKENIYAKKNKEALLNFRDYAKKMEAKLLVALISEKPMRLTEVRRFLEESEITYIDLGLNQEHRNPELFWPLNRHWNIEGNRVVANMLHEFIGDYVHENP